MSSCFSCLPQLQAQNHAGYTNGHAQKHAEYANGTRPSAPLYTLYVQEKGIRSMRIMVFLAEAQLMDLVTVVSEENVPDYTKKDIMDKFAVQIEARAGDGTGECWLPCLKHAGGYALHDPALGDDPIVDYLANMHGVNVEALKAFPMFNHGVFKDYQFLLDEAAALAGKDKLASGEAWFAALDKDGSGDVSLEEMIAGLDMTRLMAHQAMRGMEIDHKHDRWEDARKQIESLVVARPDFVNGWRLKMMLGTISDDYDSIIGSADQIVSLKPGDKQALTLKSLYTHALEHDAHEHAMAHLGKACDETHMSVKKLIGRVCKYWDNQLRSEVPLGIAGNMAILALGSPADDDGTPRPRLLGTLNKTLEAARAYPDSDIFVTGAAVSSNMPEAIAMTKWLTARGVDAKRITKEMKAMDTVGNYEYIVPMLRKRGITKVMLITVYYHLNRSSALADAVFEHRGLEVEVIGVAGESDLKGEHHEKRLKVEKPASYRDLARASCLYEHADFE